MKSFIVFFVALLYLTSLNGQPCADLFFSEYIEGSSFNKAIEIYNPTQSSVNMSGYRVLLFTNGNSTPTATLNLSGSIGAGDVYVIANSQASNPNIIAQKDTSSGVCAFNGNDALVLMKGSDTLDIFGIVGFDPGSSGWTVSGGNNAVDKTLVRKSSVQQGTTNWSVAQNQWDVYPKDTTIYLGAHTMTPCANPADTIVSFFPVSATVNENAGTFNLTLKLNQAASQTHTVDVALKSGDVADIGNYTTQTVVFAPGTTSQSLSVIITDDTLAEGPEQFVFRLTNPSSGLLIGSDSLFTLTIALSDSTSSGSGIPHYPIAAVKTNDASGVPDSLNVRCKLTGVVLGINLRATGLQFTIHDGTGGIMVFSNPKTYGYTVNQGDSIAVIGKIGFFSGVTQIIPDPNVSSDTIYVIGSGTVPVPFVTNVLDETTESELVRINNVTIINPSQWNNSNPSGFTVNITNGTSTFQLRIDEQTDLFNQSAPSGSFDVIGIGGQFDNSSPYDAGYQILPRSSSDILLHTGTSSPNTIKNKLIIYPNPVSSELVIYPDFEIQGQVRINIIEISGKSVSHIQLDVHPNSNSLRVDIPHLKQGIYVLELTTATRHLKERIVVQH